MTCSKITLCMLYLTFSSISCNISDHYLDIFEKFYLQSNIFDVK